MSRMRRRSLSWSDSGLQCNALDRDERFVVQRCALYGRRILLRYPAIDRATLSFLTFVLGENMAAVAKFLLERATGEARDEFRKGLRECRVDPEEYANIIAQLLPQQPKRLGRTLQRFLLQALEARIDELTKKGPVAGTRLLERLQTMLGLSPDEAEFCYLVYLVQYWKPAESYFEEHLQWHSPVGRKYALAALGFTSGTLNRVLGGKLKALGVLSEHVHMYRIDDDYEPFFLENDLDLTGSGLFRRVPRETLPLEYHMFEPGVTEHVLALLQTPPGRQSTHVLLYGPPGTGKSSFARALCTRLGCPAYEILKNTECKAGSQRAALVACQNLTGHGDGSVIVVDEADKLLNTTPVFWFFGSNESQDKGWLNQFLDQGGARVIWIVNSIDNIDPSVQRRFAYSLYFRPLSRSKRAVLWERVLQRHRVRRKVNATEIEALAATYKHSPGVIDLAVRKAKDIAAGTGQSLLNPLRRNLDAYAALCNEGLPVVDKEQIEQGFRLEGLNVEGDLTDLLQHCDTFNTWLRGPSEGRRLGLNLLLYGPPGTGKSELARYLGKRLDREVQVKRLSDLLDPYVGMTERHLAKAFAKAEHEEAILVLDEADYFLRSREKAMRSWEVGQTNELLTQMERFRGLLVCTTNRLDDLDPASVRRFNHKIGFKFLEPEGNLSFYEALLAPLIEGPLEERELGALRALINLAPGDFKVVRDRFALQPPQDNTHAAAVAALAEEARFKAFQQKEVVVRFG